MTESGRCQNCSTPLKGNYCYQCGQSIKGADRYFLTLVNEAFEDIFSSGSRVWKTLGNLLFRPGRLSIEYFAGHRVRYIPPIRLYFTLSILFFLVISVSTFFNEDSSVTLELNEERNAIELKLDDKNPENNLEDDESNLLNQQVKEVIREARNTNDEQADDNNININFPWFSDDRNTAINKRLRSQIDKAEEIYKVRPNSANDYFLEIAPPIIFCLLPIFALLLKVFYLGSGFYYAQHLILAVHNHCFVFLWLILLTLISLIANAFTNTLWPIITIFYGWFFVYLWRSLRTVYQQGRIATAFKFTLLSVSYVILALFSLVCALIFGIMTI